MVEIVQEVGEVPGRLLLRRVAATGETVAEEVAAREGRDVALPLLVPELQSGAGVLQEMREASGRARRGEPSRSSERRSR